MGHRRRQLSGVDASAGPVCLLTATQAARRGAPIDLVLEHGEFHGIPNGYEIRLQRDDASWLMANRFIDEEAACCPAMDFDIVEHDDSLVLHASFAAMT